jgi:formate-dependent nitrite reductase cytochrome c552 subunit
VYAVLANKVPRPIETPIRNLRPARETCQECHWPEKFFGARRVVNAHYLPDENNTADPISLLVNIGGGSAGERSEGIHWHMIVANKVEYIARDRTRQDIAWVRTTDRAGKATEYNNVDNPLSPEEKAKAEVRVMDCMDCHNRPSHNYRSPNKTVNDALSLGRISASLPFIKREAVKALDQDYPDTPAALASIEKSLTDFYRTNYPDLLKTRPSDVAAAAAEVQRIYSHNFFPEMKVAWKGYPDNIGHEEFPGCFRCHGSSLASSDGKTIAKDCRSCHILLSQGTGKEGAFLSPAGFEFKHPVDVGGAEASGQCALCHKGGAELY